MSFTLFKTTFLKGLQNVTGALMARPPMLVLSSIHCKVKDKRLELTASDLDIFLTAIVEIDNSEYEGEFLVPGKMILDLVKELPDTQLTINVEAEKIVISTNTSRNTYTVPCGSTDEYPNIPEVNENMELNLKSENLKRMISKTIFAVSVNDIRPVLSSILFQVRNGSLSLVTTDGHRLSRIRNTAVDYNGADRDMVISSKALSIFSKVADNDEDVKILVGDVKARFEMKSLTLIARLIEGNFPKYESVIPTDSPYTLECNSSDLTSALRRSILFSHIQTREVKFTLKPDEIKLNAEGVDNGGKSEESLTPISFNRDELIIAFNGQFMIEALRQIETEEFIASITNSDEAVLIRPTKQQDNEDYLLLLMPLRLK